MKSQWKYESDSLGDMDEGTRSLLYLLDQNARLSIKELSVGAHLSTRQTKYRLDAISERSIIKKSHVAINAGLLGMTQHRIMLSLVKAAPTDEIVQFVRDEHNVIWVGKVSHGYDLVLGYRTNNFFAYGEFMHRLRLRFERYFKKQDLSSVLWSRYVPRNYFVDGTSPAVAEDKLYSCVSRSSPLVLDDIDKAILDCLERNARSSYAEIKKYLFAQGLDASSETIARRERRMQKSGIITGFTYTLNHQTIGRTQVRLLLKCQAENAPKLTQLCVVTPWISKVMKMIGAWDFEINIDLPFGKELKPRIDYLVREADLDMFEYSYFRTEERIV